MQMGPLMIATLQARWLALRGYAVRFDAFSTWALLTLGLLATALVPPGADHATVRGQHVGLCVFRTVTGYDCPGCGLTRSFQAMWRGDLRRAWERHPGGPIAFAMTWLVWLELGAQVWLRRSLLRPRAARLAQVAVTASALGIAAVGAARLALEVLWRTGSW